MDKVENNENKANGDGVVFPYISAVEKDLLKEKSSKLVMSVVKKGYGCQVVKVANENGAPGAVIIDGRGSGNGKRHFFGMEITPEKEVVLMVVPEEVVYPVMKSIYAIADFRSVAKGIVFALPISLLVD